MNSKVLAPGPAPWLYSLDRFGSRQGTEGHLGTFPGSVTAVGRLDHAILMAASRVLKWADNLGLPVSDHPGAGPRAMPTKGVTQVSKAQGLGEPEEGLAAFWSQV